MTDVIRPANGQAANAQSSGNAWQAPHGTAGYDAAIRERTLVAPQSGETRAWPKRPGPGAANPAGWFRPADGEAAPRFGPGFGASPLGCKSQPGRGGDDDRGGWHRNPQPASADPVRALWPWVFPQGWRPVPVVGPTEALRDRAGSPGTAVPPGAVPGAVDPAQPSSWQLAQEVWQESGVTWERAIPELADVEPAHLEPPDPEPATARAWLADREPGDAESVGFQPAAADVWSGYAEPAARDRGDAESVGFQPAAADVWSGYAEPAAPDREDAEPASFERAAGDAWLDGPEPDDDSEPGAPDPAGFEPAAGDAWLTSAEPTTGSASISSQRASSHPPPTGGSRTRGRSTRRPPTSGSPASARPIRSSPTPGPQTSNRSASRPRPGRRPVLRRLGERPPGPSLRLVTTPCRPGARSGPARPGTGTRRGGFPGQAWPAGSGRVLPLGAPVALDPQAPESADLTEPFSAAGPDRVAGPDGAAAPGWVGGVPFSEPDELFRAWQGSVNEAAAARGPWSVPRRAASASRRRRALQAAAIGVPVAVIVTVGAGALMILTGKANEMLAVRADTGAASPAASASGSSGTRVGARPTAGGRRPPSSAPPCPATRASAEPSPSHRCMAAAGMTLAVGTADGHRGDLAPGRERQLDAGVGRQPERGGRLGRAPSVAHGPAGWIAVGATSDGRSTGPVVLASADGVRWQPVTSLAAAAGAGTEFLGAAAGRLRLRGRGQADGRQPHLRRPLVLRRPAKLDRRQQRRAGRAGWRRPPRTPSPRPRTASSRWDLHGAVQSMWISSDGRHWRMDSVAAPAGRGQRDPPFRRRQRNPGGGRGLRRHPGRGHPGGRGLHR